MLIDIIMFMAAGTTHNTGVYLGWAPMWHELCNNDEWPMGGGTYADPSTLNNCAKLDHLPLYLTYDKCVEGACDTAVGPDGKKDCGHFQAPIDLFEKGATTTGMTYHACEVSSSHYWCRTLEEQQTALITALSQTWYLMTPTADSISNGLETVIDDDRMHQLCEAAPPPTPDNAQGDAGGWYDPLHPPPANAVPPSCPNRVPAFLDLFRTQSHFGNGIQPIPELVVPAPAPGEAPPVPYKFCTNGIMRPPAPKAKPSWISRYQCISEAEQYFQCNPNGGECESCTSEPCVPADPGTLDPPVGPHTPYEPIAYFFCKKHCTPIPNSVENCIPSPCVATKASGSWKYVENLPTTGGVNSDGFKFSLETGLTSGNNAEITYSHSTDHTVKFSGGMIFGGIDASSSATSTVKNSYAQRMGKMWSETTKTKRTFTVHSVGETLWQWVTEIDTGGAQGCGTYTYGSKLYDLTTSDAYPPCCIPGYIKDKTAQYCTEPVGVIHYAAGSQAATHCVNAGNVEPPTSRRLLEAEDNNFTAGTFPIPWRYCGQGVTDTSCSMSCTNDYNCPPGQTCQQGANCIHPRTNGTSTYVCGTTYESASLGGGKDGYCRYGQDSSCPDGMKCWSPVFATNLPAAPTPTSASNDDVPVGYKYATIVLAVLFGLAGGMLLRSSIQESTARAPLAPSSSRLRPTFKGFVPALTI